ncbi:MAG: hypothetical protein M0R46_09025 [Candidatus Muirbacterium halophilum]|nr:hypothetical protein [Candidatus Muirbacterium halophilum]MCK9476048.1 hypothetical protein [Candidatus Muirbacterium halophilum]
MNKINIPEALKVKEHGDFHSEFLLEPLRKGYGETMGNFMKDLLVNELQGYSAVSILFTTMDKKTRKISGTEEQVVDIVMNVKNIICRINGADEYTKKVSFKGAKNVKAGDLADSTLEVFNKDLHLFQVTSDFEAEITFKKGNGYILSYEHKKEPKVPFNKFYIDSFFSPITLVEMDVSQIRVGGHMNFERLTLEIKTNGTVKPKEAVKSISDVVKDRLEIFSEKRERKVYQEVILEKEEEADYFEEDEEEEEIVEKKENIVVEEILVMELELSQRAKNCLKNFPYKKLVDFTRVSADELMRLKNFGQKTLDEIREKLSDHGLTLKGETLD